jgi:hypothetical protein
VSDINTAVVDGLKVLDLKRPIREEKREPVSDINTAVVDGLKVLDLKRPIREADKRNSESIVCYGKDQRRSTERTTRDRYSNLH